MTCSGDLRFAIYVNLSSPPRPSPMLTYDRNRLQSANRLHTSPRLGHQSSATAVSFVLQTHRQARAEWVARMICGIRAQPRVQGSSHRVVGREGYGIASFSMISRIRVENQRSRGEIEDIYCNGVMHRCTLLIMAATIQPRDIQLLIVTTFGDVCISDSSYIYLEPYIEQSLNTITRCSVIF